MKKSKRETTPDSGPFAFEGLDRVLHEKARLGILSSLIANPQGLLFAELKTLCSLTDGNLNRHVQVLQKAGLVEIWKGNQGNRTLTLVRMTEVGRRRFLEYIGLLEQIVSEAVEAAGAKSSAASVGKNAIGLVSRLMELRGAIFLGVNFVLQSYLLTTVKRQVDESPSRESARHVLRCARRHSSHGRHRAARRCHHSRRVGA